MKTNALLFINNLINKLWQKHKIINNSSTINAQMAKLVDASDLNSDDYYNRAGSIPALSTFINLKTIIMRAKKSIRAWVARDRSGKIFLYRDKPRKDTNQQHSMTIRRSYSNSILTSISEFLIALIIILIAAISISKYCTDYDYYNYVELKAQYKNYIVTNKYIRNSDTYVLELMNPFSKKTEEVYIKDYLYYNTYFVGDTIK